MKNVNSWVPIIAILLVLGMLGSMIFDGTKDDPLTINHSTKTPQLSFVPQGFTRSHGEGENIVEFTPEFDPRFLKLRPQVIFQIPKVNTFSAPMGTESGAFTYSTQKFWEYSEQQHGYHTGNDVKGIGGGGSDLHDPVYAVADGYVAYTGVPSEEWGKVVLVAHRISVNGEDRIIQSMYANLDSYAVKVGDVVYRSQILGKVGHSGEGGVSHLHFEMREGTNLYIGSEYPQSPGTQLATQEFLTPYLESDFIFAEVERAIELSENPWLEVEIRNPMPFLELDK